MSRNDIGARVCRRVDTQINLSPTITHRYRQSSNRSYLDDLMHFVGARDCLRVNPLLNPSPISTQFFMRVNTQINLSPISVQYDRGSSKR